MEYDDIVSVERETAFCSDTATYTFNRGCPSPPEINRGCRSPQEINRGCPTHQEINLGGPEPQQTEQRATDEGVYEELNSSDNKPTVQDDITKRININLALVIVLYVAVIPFAIVLTIVFVLPEEQDGEWSSWQNWSSCSESCGGGMMSRNRACSNPKPEGMGMQCTGSFEEISLCNKQPCPGTDGEWSSWQDWSSCSESCGGGMMSRNRTCSNPKPEGMGKQCTGSFEEISLCNRQPCPGTDGEWSSWKNWSSCSESCGGGMMSRNRACSNPKPEGMGKQCTGSFEEVSLCNKQLCPGTDGKWSSWQDWSSCSESCGGGMMSRNRACSNPKPEGTGRQCTGSFEEVSLCNRQPCPGTDGVWSVWESWGTCSHSCGGGVRSRSRSCTNPSPSLTGRPCTGDDMDVSVCSRTTCPDGGWSVWESWGTCSHSCGGGVRSRSRSCTNPDPSLTGRPCTGDAMDVSVCNRKTCPEYNVAFMAYDLNTKPTSETTLQFRSVYLNNGNAYNTTSGKFTCNVPGVYHFEATLTKARKDNGYMSVYLRINYSSKFKLLYNPDNDGNIEIGTSIMTGAGSFHLSRNDVVDVNGVPNEFYTCSICSSFTGFLITPDQ